MNSSFQKQTRIKKKNSRKIKMLDPPSKKKKVYTDVL